MVECQERGGAWSEALRRLISPRLLDSDTFVQDQSDSGPPMIDSKASQMAISKFEVAWLMFDGEHVRMMYENLGSARQ